MSWDDHYTARWDELSGHVDRLFEYENAIFDARHMLLDSIQITRPTRWWELWTIPRGEIVFRDDRKRTDVTDWGGNIVATLQERYLTYMEFTPDCPTRFLTQLVRHPSTKGGSALTNRNVIDWQALHGDWGWYDPAKNLMQTVVYGICEYALEKPGRPFVAAVMKEPPPYGLWLPALGEGLS